MAVELSLPTLGTILATAVVDSINPCAIGVLILLLSTLVVAKSKTKMIEIGLMYIGAVFLTYFLFGLGLVTFLSNIPLVWAEYISIVVGVIVVLAGILEIKDYFWYGHGVSLAISPKYAKRIKEKMQNVSIGTVIFLGIFVASVELPCTGGPYLAITLILSQNFNVAAFLMLVLYNIIFVMPLVIILLCVALGAKLNNIHKWKQGNKAFMRLITGVVLIGLGILLILIANGVINLN